MSTVVITTTTNQDAVAKAAGRPITAPDHLLLRNVPAPIDAGIGDNNKKYAAATADGILVEQQEEVFLAVADTAAAAFDPTDRDHSTSSSTTKATSAAADYLLNAPF
jgi:hypothetical protein